VEYASWCLDGNYTDTGLTTAQLVNKSASFRDGAISIIGNPGTGNGIGIDELRFTQTLAVDVVLGGTNLQGVAQLFSGIERIVIGTGLGNVANRTGRALINIDASLLGSPGGLGSTQGLELLGNAANNIFVGTAFDDLLDGGAGADTLEGGLGNDTYVIDNAGDVIVEGLLGGGMDTIIVGFNTNYTLGDDQENLTLIGGSGLGLIGANSTANMQGTGNALANTIIGNAGNNLLLGLAGNDNLQGAAGNDTLDGGAGVDTLTGGSGIDVFRFSSVADIGNNPLLRETINDFLTGTDRLDFSAIDADTTRAGQQQFSFVATSGILGAGLLRFENGILFGYDGSMNFQIQIFPSLPNSAPLTLSDADLLTPGNGNSPLPGIIGLNQPGNIGINIPAPFAVV
jgi:Ca2+-binding RTX toxin-like protein